jgi:hypothetical protein
MIGQPFELLVTRMHISFASLEPGRDQPDSNHFSSREVFIHLNRTPLETTMNRQQKVISGKVIQYVEKEKFSFNFGDMQVDLYFDVLGDQTEVERIYSNIPLTDEGKVIGHLGWHSRWVYVMTNLSSVLHYGKDLRDENTKLVASMELGFTPGHTSERPNDQQNVLTLPS